MKNLLTVFATVLTFNTAYAEFMDGNDLIVNMQEFEKIERFEKSADYIKAVEFRGFVLGVFDTLEYSNLICASESTKRQVSLVVVKYMNANPELWSRPAALLVSNALRSAFPCKK